MIILQRTQPPDNQDYPSLAHFLFQNAGLLPQEESSNRENDDDSRTTWGKAKNDDGDELRSKTRKLPTNVFSQEKHLQRAGAHEIDIPMHIEENNSSIVLQLDVPGFSVNDLEVMTDDGFLRLSGERCNKFGYRAMFARRFPLDESRIETRAITADLSEGVLTVTFPKKQVAQRRVIPIEVKISESKASTDESKWNNVVAHAEEEVSVETVDENEE